MLRRFETFDLYGLRTWRWEHLWSGSSAVFRSHTPEFLGVFSLPKLHSSALVF